MYGAEQRKWRRRSRSRRKRRSRSREGLTLVR